MLQIILFTTKKVIPIHFNNLWDDDDDSDYGLEIIIIGIVLIIVLISFCIGACYWLLKKRR